MPASTPLVCVHGWAMSAAVWQPLLAKLPIQHPVSCPELPGHGAAAPLPQMGLDGIAQSLAASVSRPSVWVGWSLGAMVAVHVARRYPDKVAGLVLLANTPRFVRADDWPCAVEQKVFTGFASDLAQDYERTLRRFLALQVLGSKPANMRETIRQLQQQMPAPDAGALQQGLDILLNTDQRDDYCQLTVPVSCVLGGDDKLVPVAAGAAISALNRQISIEYIDGAGHAPLMSHSDVVASQIETLCAQVQQQAAGVEVE
ncbi:MAG TPA: pimeloyl-[acyl-carrier protein] methyl ester esterase [Gammaproteobacteria bacterium]|nr:pimeloyl-[acyl-carrier protein] methyl ester esterase [Gammaproteobacteria bacterium]